jgi:hypothetical protein
VLSVVCPDGHDGMPGNRKIVMTYTLTPDNEFKVDYVAETDKATHMNISHHSFFNLKGEGNGTINDHVLCINASFTTPVNEVLIPSGEISETQMKAITMHTKAMGGYTLRRVSDMGSLMEKVLVHDAGLDDVAVEMCKYVTKLEMVQKMVDQDRKDAFLNSVFHFYRSEEEVLTFMYGMDGQMMGVNVGMNVYQDCIGILERNPQMKPSEGFELIDAAWLSSRLA